MFCDDCGGLIGDDETIFYDTTIEKGGHTACFMEPIHDDERVTATPVPYGYENEEYDYVR